MQQEITVFLALLLFHTKKIENGKITEEAKVFFLKSIE